MTTISNWLSTSLGKEQKWQPTCQKKPTTRLTQVFTLALCALFIINSSLSSFANPSLPTISPAHPTQKVALQTTTGKPSSRAEQSLIHPKIDQHQTTPIDPLLNDDLIYQAPPSVQKTHKKGFSPQPIPNLLNKRYLPIGSATRTKETLANLRLWVNDALESAPALKIKLPVQDIRENMVMADTYETYGDQFQTTGEIGRSQYAYQKAADYLYDAVHQVTPSSSLETRAIWLDRKSIVNSKSPAALRKIIRQLADTGINLIYFETVNAGFPIYPSQILSQNPLAKGWDPLKVAVDEAHKRGIELHAWVWAFAVGNTRHNPLIGKSAQYTSPYFEELGLNPQTHAMQMRNGSIMPPRQTEYWMSPASTQGRQALKNVFHEIVAQYKVDGLHLDYIRYPFQHSNDPAGMEAISRQKFARDTHRHPMSFTRWKTQQVSSFVHEVSDELRAVNPDIILSAAVFPMSRGQRISAIQQDWETWLEKGWVDTVSPMVYTTSPHLFAHSIQRIFNNVSRPEAIYPGVALFRLDGDELLNHLQLIQQLGGRGLTLFASAHLNPDLQELLQTGPYKQVAYHQPHQHGNKHYIQLANVLVKRLKTIQNNPQLLSSMSPTQQHSFVTDLNQFEKQLKSLQSNHSGSMPDFGNHEQTFQHIKQRLQAWYPTASEAHPYRVLQISQWIDELNLMHQRQRLGHLTLPKLHMAQSEIKTVFNQRPHK